MRRIDLVVAEVAAAPEQVVELVGRARIAGELRLHLGQRVRVEQVAQLLLAEQLAQEVAVERERLRPPLGGRRVVLVHVGGDVGEEQRRGERRGRGRLDLDEVELAGLDAVEDALQRRQVEDVLQALAVGLEHDRERAVVARDLEQALGLQPLLPQRRALARATTRDQERAGGVLPEPRSEQRGAPHLLDDELLDLVRRRSRSAIGGSTSASGRWSAIPSSDQIDCTSSPSASRSRAPSAIAHGACTRAPNGVRMHRRQSPISSRKRSTTIVRSDGTTPPFAAAWSRR